MRIRLEGTRPEIATALTRLRHTLIVGHVSPHYPNRRRGSYRVYVDAYPPGWKVTHHARQENQHQHPRQDQQQRENRQSRHEARDGALPAMSRRGPPRRGRGRIRSPQSATRPARHLLPL